MAWKFLTAGACVLALAACGSDTPNPELLKGATFVSAQPGTDITITFDPTEMRVSGQVVNLYNGGYSVDGDKIAFEGFASTMMMGEKEAMETEQEYFQFMPTVQTYELADGKLTLIAADGKEIIFTQVETVPAEAPADAPADAPVAPAAAE